ncbi:MAG: competence protein ComFB [Leptolyngbya sp. ERB_1_1]
MEVLVAEEVTHQIEALPHKLARQTNPADVAAFALNRLPALYATTKRGWQRQWKRGKGELQAQISTAVRQGIMAVQRDPLQADSLLTIENAAETALEDLKQLLQCEQLSWQNLPSVVRLALMDTLRGKITWAAPKSNEFFDWEAHPHHQKG